MKIMPCKTINGEMEIEIFLLYPYYYVLRLLVYDFFHFSVFRFVLMSQNMVYLSECSVCKRIHVQLLGEVLYKC